MKTPGRIICGTLITAALCTAGCTLGLIHTRESDQAFLYLQSEARRYQQRASPLDQGYNSFFASLKIHPDVSAILKVESIGHHVEPITPEGMFPLWADISVFELTGSGRLEVSDGTEWMCYEVPGTASSEGKKYTKGTIRLAKDYTTVVLDLRMSSRYWFGYSVNHSGQFKVTLIKAPANNSPEATPAQRPPASPSPSSGAPQL